MKGPESFADRHFFAHVTDERTRECLALEAKYSITRRGVIDILQSLGEESGASKFMR